MSASKVLVGAVCLPKYLSPPPNHLVHSVYLYSLFLKIHTYVCTHLHIHSPAAFCRLSAARAAHVRTCSHPVLLLLSIIPRLHTQHRHTSTHLHRRECTSIYMYLFPVHTCPGSTSPQNVDTHRKPTCATICPGTGLCMHTCPRRYSHACWEGSGTQVVLSPPVRLMAFLHHFGIDKVDILKLSFLAPGVLPLPGSATAAADNVPSQSQARLAGLVKVC